MVRPVTILFLRAWTRAMSIVGLRVGLAEADAPLGGVLRDLQRVRVLEQRLGRNAAPVEAGAAERRLALDDGGLQAELRGANGGDVPAGAGADDDDVESDRPSGQVYARRAEAGHVDERLQACSTSATKRRPASTARGHARRRALATSAERDYLRGRTASLSCLAMRALTTVLAGILIGSPVAGLRPSRAFALDDELAHAREGRTRRTASAPSRTGGAAPRRDRAPACASCRTCPRSARTAPSCPCAGRLPCLLLPGWGARFKTVVRTARASGPTANHVKTGRIVALRRKRCQ